MTRKINTFLFACLAVAALAILPGCGRKPVYPLPPDGVSRFIDGTPLQVGDIVLGRSYGLFGAMFANHSLEDKSGKFSHGSMIYRDDTGRLMMLNFRPTGMETCTPEEYFTRYNRLALLRRNAGFAQAKAPAYVGCGAGVTGEEALSVTARYWLAKNKKKKVPADFDLDHDEHSAMFCLELASTVYRDCGLPDPFYFARKTADYPLLIKGNKMFKTNVVELRSPSSVLSNPDFTLIHEWLRPEFDLREEALNEELMNIVVEDLENGLEPMRPRLGGRMKLRQLFAVYHIVTRVMFWRPSQELPPKLDAEVIDNGYMLYTYLSGAKAICRERMAVETSLVNAATPDPGPTLAYVRAMAREECAKRRDYFLNPRGRAVVAPKLPKATKTTAECGAAKCPAVKTAGACG